MDAQHIETFPDPTALAAMQLTDLLEAASRGHVAIDHRFIHAILDRGAEAVPELLKFGLANRDDDRVDLEEDLIAIFRHWRTPDALPFYLECVRRDPEDIPDDVVQGILDSGESAIEPLLELYEELEEDQSSDVAFLLASMPKRDDRILTVLLDRLEYSIPDGAFCLGIYGDPAARPALEKSLTLIPEKDAELTREVNFAIEQLSDEPPARTPDLEPFDIWEMYSKEAPLPVDALTESERLSMLDSASPVIRAQGASSFRGNDLRPEVRSVLIKKAKSDPDPEVRGRCWEALAEALDEREVRDAMKAALTGDRPVIEQCGALIGLANAADDPAIAAKMREFYEEPATRARAMEAMWRSLDRQFADYFPKHLADPDLDIRRQAIWGVGYSGTGSLAGDLRKFFDDEDLRVDALFAYALCVPAELSRGRVRSLLRKIEDAAGGLSPMEGELVQAALDERLMMRGMDPVFSESPDGDVADEEAAAEEQTEAPGRNDPCPCGSGKKFKKCHGSA